MSFLIEKAFMSPVSSVIAGLNHVVPCVSSGIQLPVSFFDSSQGAQPIAQYPVRAARTLQGFFDRLVQPLGMEEETYASIDEYFPENGQADVPWYVDGLLGHELKQGLWYRDIFVNRFANIDDELIDRALFLRLLQDVKTKDAVAIEGMYQEEVTGLRVQQRTSVSFQNHPGLKNWNDDHVSIDIGNLNFIPDLFGFDSLGDVSIGSDILLYSLQLAAHCLRGMSSELGGYLSLFSGNRVTHFSFDPSTPDVLRFLEGGLLVSANSLTVPQEGFRISTGTMSPLERQQKIMALSKGLRSEDSKERIRSLRQLKALKSPAEFSLTYGGDRLSISLSRNDPRIPHGVPVQGFQMLMENALNLIRFQIDVRQLAIQQGGDVYWSEGGLTANL